MEIPITFAMTMAWDVESISSDGLTDFFSAMALRDIGSGLSQNVGAAWHEYDRLVSLRRHEHIEPSTFSLLHYNEAEIILERWKSLLMNAKAIYDRISKDLQPAAFELVLHPIKASYIFTTLQIMLGKNQIFARQRRNSTNKLALEVLRLFDEDYSLSEEFHQLLDGKWNQIMRQTHYGYEETWHAPSRDMISGLCYVQRRQSSNPIVGQMGVAVEGHMGVRPGLTNEESDRTHPSRRDLTPGVTLGQMSRYGPLARWVDIFSRGTYTIHWKASVPYGWIHLSHTSGFLEPDEYDSRIEISIDWERVPVDFHEEILIDIRSEEGDFEQIHLPVNGRTIPDSFQHGFIEADGYVSMPASLTSIEDAYYVLPDAGRSEFGLVALADITIFPPSYLEYEVHTFTSDASAALVLYFNMTLDFDPTTPMTYELQIDEELPQTHRLIVNEERKGGLPSGWLQAVQDCVWVRKHATSDSFLRAGRHTLRIRLLHTNLLLEKLLVDLGGVSESYLGPPSSQYVNRSNRT